MPNEFLEAYYPLRMEIYETCVDSGGPGLHRGGNGIKIGYRILNAGEVSIHDDRWLTYPWGVNGGLPGGRSRKELIRRDGTMEVLPSKCDHVKVEEGDLLLLYTWGGGGWGDPYQRDAQKVTLDVDRGLVSKEGALRYGVVINSDSTVDEKATEELRAKSIGERGEVKLFDRGFDTIEELKTRCFEETGINPPKQPTFPRHIMEFLRREESQKPGVAAD